MKITAAFNELCASHFGQPAARAIESDSLSTKAAAPFETAHLYFSSGILAARARVEAGA